ncbi:histidine kinase N-terminal 7TM domain-containing protein, partial [Chloroflexota bacterium]
MNIFSIFPLVAAVIYILLMGVLIGHRPWRRRQKLFAAFIGGALLWSIGDVLFRTSYFGDYKLLLARLTFCSFTLMLVPFCYFVASYYERGRDNWLFLAYISFAANVILAALGYQPNGVQTGLSIFPHYNLLLLLVFTAVPFLVLAARGVYYLIRRLMLAENALIHAQVTYLLLTVAILTLSALSNIFPIGRELPISHVGNLMVALILGYATFRHQLLDLKSVTWRGLVYGGVGIVIAASYLILLYVFQRWFHYKFDVASIIFVLCLAIIITIVLYPLRKVLQRGVEHLLYPATYDYRKTLLEFGNKASSILDIDELGRELTRLVASAVGAGKAYLLLPDSSGGDLKVRFGVPDVEESVAEKLSLTADSPVINWVEREGKPLFCES